MVGNKGRFRIEDVVPGDYSIFCYFRSMQAVRILAPARGEFTMPAMPGGGYSDKPLVIPDIIMQSP
jgi:hypothetical protein